MSSHWSTWFNGSLAGYRSTSASLDLGHKACVSVADDGKVEEENMRDIVDTSIEAVLAT